MNKKCITIGGGTFNHVRNHLALAAPAFSETARKLAEHKTALAELGMVQKWVRQ